MTITKRSIAVVEIARKIEDSPRKRLVVDVGAEGGVEAMPTRVRRILADPDVELLLSVASQIELAIKTRIGKLELKKDELAAICTKASITSYPLRHHADRLFELPMHHKDPFDRLIISTALCDNLSVISCDKQFRKYRGLRVIWQENSPPPSERFVKNDGYIESKRENQDVHGNRRRRSRGNRCNYLENLFHRWR